MKSNFLQLVVNTSRCVLSSKSLFYKTEDFIKQTQNITSIDVLLSKLGETILLNLNDILVNETLNSTTCFFIETTDKLYKFKFKFGENVSKEFNKFDILFFEYEPNNNGITNNLKIEEYVKPNTNLRVIVKKYTQFVDNKQFNKVYLVSNVSNVNLPKLDKTQNEIVKTIADNILVQGVAGSGKTNLCIDKIIFTACQNYSGKTLYTTFSRGLLNDTKLKIDNYVSDLKFVLNSYKSGNLTFLDNDHKKALENKLGIYFFVNDNNQVFDKLESIINYLTTKVDYMLIEDIYKLKFNAQSEFVNESYFVNAYSVSPDNHQIVKCFSKLSHLSKEIIFKEIYGMVLGSFTSLEMLTLDEYILKRENSFSKSDCETIYQIAVDYNKHLIKNNLCDNNLASYKLIKKLDNDVMYSLSVIDEVQDYTQVNLQLLKKISLKMFCVGDALQMINPSYFNFGYLKNLMYEKDLVEVKELKYNYRNSKKITEIIDALGEVNKQEFGTHNFVINGVSVDNSINSNAVMVNESSFIKQMATSEFEDITFVVSSLEAKNKLKNVIKQQEVLTVSEIKGLERNNVIVYDLLSSNLDKWQTLGRNKVNHKLADENSVYRYYYNLFYVGVSRAKLNLIVFESALPEQFKNFSNKCLTKLSATQTIDMLTKVVTKAQFTQTELSGRVQEFLKLEQYDNARFSASKIKDEALKINTLRTIDIYANLVHFGKHREAGIKFWEYGLITEAKQQFALSGDKILIELVDICSRGSNTDLNIEILKYYTEVKDNKVARDFILETVVKDIKNLKSSFTDIKNTLKKGRK